MMLDSILNQESRNTSKLDFGSQLGQFSFKFDDNQNKAKESLKMYDFTEQDTKKAIEGFYENPIFKPEDNEFKFNFDEYEKPTQNKIDNDLSSCTFGDDSKGDMFRFPAIKQDYNRRKEQETYYSTKDSKLNYHSWSRKS